METLANSFLTKPIKYIIERWHTCSKRKRHEMEEDASNPTSLYNFTVPSSNKSSKVIFVSKNTSSPESNSASSSQKKSKMAKLSFNEMFFLSQTGSTSSTRAYSQSRAPTMELKRTPSINIIPADYNMSPQENLDSPQMWYRIFPRENQISNDENKNLFNLDLTQSRSIRKMDSKFDQSGAPEDPILVNDEDDNQSEASDYESTLNLLKQFDHLTKSISDISFDTQASIFDYEHDFEKMTISQKEEYKKEEIPKEDVKRYYNDVQDYLFEKILKERQNFPTITLDQYKKVLSIWESRIPESTVVAKFDYIPQVLSIKNLRTLSGTSWLNDEVINAYLELIMRRDELLLKKRIKCLNTFIYPMILECVKAKNFDKVFRALKRKKIVISELWRVFIPINIHKNHWAFFHIDVQEKRIVYHDSMNHNANETKQMLNHIATFVEAAIKQEAVENPKLEDPEGKFEIVDNLKAPKQDNMSDCGVFTLKGIEYLSRGADITFSAKDMKFFRMLITVELCLGKLLTPNQEKVG